MRPRTRATAVTVALTATVATTIGTAVATAGGTSGAGAATASSSLPVPTLPRPRDFVARVTNPWLPFTPGSRWVYDGRGAEKGEHNVVRVLHRTRRIEGIGATVVHDVVREDGQVSEDTYDFYAQDRLGNVWYLGERTREYDGGTLVSTEGSWLAGRGKGRPGIAMPAHPVLGQRYRQEYDPGNAEDQAQVLLGRGQVRVPAGRYAGVRVTDETTALEPRVDEMKFYARGVGVVLELGLSPQFSRSVLVSAHVE